MKWTEFGGPGLMTAEEYAGKLEARLAAAERLIRDALPLMEDEWIGTGDRLIGVGGEWIAAARAYLEKAYSSDAAIRDRLNGHEYDVAADNATDLNSEKPE